MDRLVKSPEEHGREEDGGKHPKVRAVRDGMGEAARC